MSEVKLPDKLSDLLELAVNDCQVVFESELYVENMGLWHFPGPLPGQRCSVCMAGAVMANTLKVPAYEDADPANFPGESRKLVAIDSMRNGNMFSAYTCLTNIVSEGDTEAVLQKAASLIDNNYLRRLARAPWPVYRECVILLREGGL